MRKDRCIHIGFRICIVAVLLLTVLSRAVGLTYNLSIHPDESEFYTASESLARHLLDPNVPFVEEKEYPEGGYILHLPFQLMKEFLGSSHWFWNSSQCWNRISSLFYFTLSALYGILILTNHMSKSKLAAILYALTMCFSVFFIEHSRYGVGDMGSLWLLMAIVYHSARALETKNLVHLVFAFFCTGAMGAVKYPQLFFAIIPVGTYLKMNGQNKSKSKNVGGMILLLSVVVLSFLMFSPKAAADPAYILRVITREGEAYLAEGSGYQTGGAINHILSIVVYTLLYSDYPLSFLLVAAFFIQSIAGKRAVNGSDYLFYKLLPVTVILFFGYNIFVTTLVFRTLTPFFGMTALYAAEAAGKLYHSCNRKGYQAGRTAVLLLTCAMVLRGGLLLWITGNQGDEKDRFTSLIAESVDEHWSQVTLLHPYNVATEYTFADYLQCPQDLPVTELHLEHYAAENKDLILQPGELLITGAYDYWRAASYFISPEKDEIKAQWESFKQVNQDYYVGQIYPTAGYYLFGAWVRGGTLAQFLIPCNMVYYRSA